MLRIRRHSVNRIPIFADQSGTQKLRSISNLRNEFVDDGDRRKEPFTCKLTYGAHHLQIN
jgi:hypothetical protein